MQIVSIGDNLNEMSNLFTGKNMTRKTTNHIMDNFFN